MAVQVEECGCNEAAIRRVGGCNATGSGPHEPGKVCDDVKLLVVGDLSAVLVDGYHASAVAAPAGVRVAARIQRQAPQEDGLGPVPGTPDEHVLHVPPDVGPEVVPVQRAGTLGEVDVVVRVSIVHRSHDRDAAVVAVPSRSGVEGRSLIHHCPRVPVQPPVVVEGEDLHARPCQAACQGDSVVPEGVGDLAEVAGVGGVVGLVELPPDQAVAGLHPGRSSPWRP